MNIREILNQAAAGLKKAGVTSARLDAEVLLASLLNVDHLELYKAPEKSLPDEAIEQFADWLARRSCGEPVAYIIGRKEFWSLSFEVNSNVLIPRPETEILVEETLKAAEELGTGDVQILEIGVGSGAVSIALATELPEARLVATDVSAEALALARRNARTLGVDGRIDFRQARYYDLVTEEFAIIVSNPPYISAEDYADLPRGVKAYEPQEALLAGIEGTECHREIIAGAGDHLKDGGWLLMEMGDDQKDRIEGVLNDARAYDCIEVRRDYGGTERVIKAKKRRISG